MSLKIAAIAIFVLSLVVVDAQYLPMSSAVLTSGVRLSSYNRECFRRADCGLNQNCVMYDFNNYPSMWPPCPHYGYCECIDGTVMVNNGSCVPYINLNLGDRCYNQINERYDTSMYRCDGQRIVCALPYILTNGYCQMPVQTYPTYASIFYTQPRTIWVQPIIPAITAPAYVVVNYRDACDSGRKICDAARGLCCTQRGPNNGYSQCLCCNKQNVYDEGLGYCRPRVYGDLCTETEECGSGLISNTGYECRLGRCRCVAGYDPVDNLYWNETSRTTYSRRICVVSGAVHWVPTGQSCTMYPEQWAQFNSTRVCHRRAFCHLCYRERNSASTNTGTAVTGTCRELTCSGEGDCQASAAGIGMACHRWQDVVDPPCENGMCGCSGAGLYIDRFSRCAPYRKLQLGDRCLVPGSSLNAWYTNNEDWDESQECIDQGVGQGGYPGYSWGVLKCKLPLIEDYDGTCRRNDDLAGILYTTLNYMDQCDDVDNRIPIARCDSTRGLVCRNKRCDCGTSGISGAVSLGGFVGGSGYSFWDGARCRTRDYGDQCNQTVQCQSGTFYPGSGGNAAVCYQGVCTCGSGFTAVDVGSLQVDFGGYQVKQSIRKYCLRNFTVVPKGSECHMDPIGFITRYSDAIRYGTALICQPGTFCMRCPADFAPDDEARGVCRSFNQPPPAAGQPCDGGMQVRQIVPPWTGWAETPNVIWQSWQPPVIWQAWQPPVVWQAWQPPVVWQAWQPPVVWQAWQPPPVWTTWQPPPVWTTWLPPPIWTTFQPPVVWTSYVPPVVWSTYRPPVVWQPWVAPQQIYAQPTWAPRVPPPPVPIMYAPPTQQLWNTWSAWCRSTAAVGPTYVSHLLLALATIGVLFVAH